MLTLEAAAIALAALVLVGSAVAVGSALVPVVRPRAASRGLAGDWSWQVVVPWPGGAPERLERAVREIGAAFPGARIWVVTDPIPPDAASHRDADTRTSLGGGGNVRRIAADGWTGGRRGLARALDAAYREIDRALPSGRDRARTIVAVITAEDSPAVSAGLAAAVTGRHLLGDAAIGGVQVSARVTRREARRRRSDRETLSRRWSRLVARLQDIEARGPVAAAQLSRRLNGTAWLGGTGQFVRLSALDGLAGAGAAPWTGSGGPGMPGGTRVRSNRAAAPEDLAVRLWLSGWRTTYTGDGWVSRVAPDGVLGYLDQRARWAMEAMRAAPLLSVLRLVTRGPTETPDRGASSPRTRDIVRAVLAPWLSLLAAPAAGLVAGLALVGGGLWLAGSSAAPTQFLAAGGWLVLPMFVVLAFGEFWLWGAAYGRWVEPELGLRRGLMHGLAYPVLAVPAALASWRALWRWIAEDRGAPRSVQPPPEPPKQAEPSEQAEPPETSAPSRPVAPVYRESAVLEPAVLEPAVLEPAVLEPAVLEPAVLEPKGLEPAHAMAPRPASYRPAAPDPPASRWAGGRPADTAGRHRGTLQGSGRAPTASATSASRHVLER